MISKRKYNCPFLLAVLLSFGQIRGNCAMFAPRAITDAHPLEKIPRLIPPEADGVMGVYKTWSIFLICSPGWLLRNKDEGVRKLYREFQIFGAAIGSKDDAVWFSKHSGDPAIDNIDLNRNHQYCHKYGLVPSTTPAVLVTTDYPGDRGLGERYVVRLNGLDASESASALDQISDQLSKASLNQADLDREAFWGKVWKASTDAMGAVGCYLNKVSIEIDAGILKGKIGHSSNGKC